MTQTPTDALRLVPEKDVARAKEWLNGFGGEKSDVLGAYIRQLEAAAPASPLPEGGGPYENVPVKRKLEAGAALRDRLKAVGDGLGSQVVADLVGSLRASHQNSAALFAQLNDARSLLKPFAAMADAGDQRPKDDAVWAGQDGLRITYGDFRAARAFLARNGKGEG